MKNYIEILICLFTTVLFIYSIYLGTRLRRLSKHKKVNIINFSIEQDLISIYNLGQVNKRINATRRNQHHSRKDLHGLTREFIYETHDKYKNVCIE